ncbi:efflux RND transporter permease subunit [Vibrio fluvialis]|nr:efflux RND transporter permease subunit [Vibrio fluvialis]ELO1814821.1 efflux RND transporter permease subunit [Vibrio fluvialis]
MIAYFTRHKTAANVLMLVILLLGGFALPQLQRDTFPLTPTRNIEVRVTYPGASPSEVAQELCVPLQDAIDQLIGVEEFVCDARENVAIGNVRIQSGQNIDILTADVQQQVNAIDDLPDRAERPKVTKLDRVASVVSVAITGPMPERDLYRYAQQLKQRLKAHSGIAQVTLSGFSDQEIEVSVSDAKLRQHGLSISDLVNRIAQENVRVPAGIVTSDLTQWNIRFDQQANLVSQLQQLIIDSSSQLRLGDIAQIQQLFAVEEEKRLFNGQRAAFLQISKNQEQDTLRVRNIVQQVIDHERSLLPPGVELTLTQDISVNIRERLRLLLSNGLQGLLLAFAVLWAFFNLRFSFWVTLGLPVSFLGAVFAMHTLGYTINMMTMVGLIVATGLLMDDSLIIAENIAAKREAGLGPVDAAIQGTRQVFPGVIASYITTIMVVGPLMFLNGNLGDVLRYIPIVLILTLTVSLLEAMLILPAHLSHSHFAQQDKPIRQVITRNFEYVRDRLFVPLTEKAIHSPYLSLSILIMLVMISTATFPAGWLKFRAMPTLESDTLQARILLPQGNLLSQTDAVVTRVTDALKTIDAAYQEKYAEPLIISTTVMYNTNVDAFESGPHVATVSADLLPAQFRQESIKSLIQQWKKNVGPFADVLSLKFTDKERGVAGNGIDIRIQGPNPETLYAVSLNLGKWLKQFDGVFNLSSDLRYGREEIVVSLKDQAGVLGVTASTVAQTLRNAFKGNNELNVYQNGEILDIRVRQRDFQHHATLEEMKDLMITASNGRLIPLVSVANFTQHRTFSRLNLVNGLPTVTVQGNINTQVANAFDIMQQFYKVYVPELNKKYPDVTFVSQGQDKESADTGASLLHYFLMGVIGVYLVLVLLFRSFTQPLAVLIAIPMAWIGVVWGHLALNLDLTIPSLVGFATLAGIVVNDNILLVTFIKEKVAGGADLKQACTLAVRDRFRAIMITSLTTFAGLLPLLTETSTQAQFLIPLIASIAFGLISATLLAAVVVACVLLILNDINPALCGEKLNA